MFFTALVQVVQLFDSMSGNVGVAFDGLWIVEVSKASKIPLSAFS